MARLNRRTRLASRKHGGQPISTAEQTAALFALGTLIKAKKPRLSMSPSLKNRDCILGATTPSGSAMKNTLQLNPIDWIGDDHLPLNAVCSPIREQIELNFQKE